METAFIDEVTAYDSISCGNDLVTSEYVKYKLMRSRPPNVSLLHRNSCEAQGTSRTVLNWVPVTVRVKAKVSPESTGREREHCLGLTTSLNNRRVSEHHININSLTLLCREVQSAVNESQKPLAGDSGKQPSV